MLLVLSLVAVAGGESGCHNASCPEVACADPVYNTDTCCLNCSHSSCQFQGCVRYNGHGPSWSPSNCCECFCLDGETRCYSLDTGCAPLYCEEFGFTEILEDCCPSCDYGVPEDECRLVPVRNQTVTFLSGGIPCQKEVTLHDCDKRVARTTEGLYYQCLGLHTIMVAIPFPECPQQQAHPYIDVQSCYRSNHPITVDSINGGGASPCAQTLPVFDPYACEVQ